jgi:uncharacterized protein YndB with AHSA1/START domain
MPYDFTLTTVMPASAQEVYDAWLDSLAHTEMTGGEARMSTEVDAEISAWDGYISGRNLHLVPHLRIVQSWRSTKFTDTHEDSVVTLSLEETDEGTLLTLVHSNVPDGQTSYEQGGWEKSYFVPMKAYFGRRRQAPANPKAKAARPRIRAAKPASSRAAAKTKARAKMAAKQAPANKATPKRPAPSKAPAKKTVASKAAAGKTAWKARSRPVAAKPKPAKTRAKAKPAASPARTAAKLKRTSPRPAGARLAAKAKPAARAAPERGKAAPRGRRR